MFDYDLVTFEYASGMHLRTLILSRIPVLYLHASTPSRTMFRSIPCEHCNTTGVFIQAFPVCQAVFCDVLCRAVLRAGAC